MKTPAPQAQHQKPAPLPGWSPYPRLGRTLAIIHLLFVAVIALAIHSSSDGNAVMGWLVFLFVDFPVSFGMIPLAYVINDFISISVVDSEGQYRVYRDVGNFWLPILYNGIIGSLWWYFWPQWLVKLIRTIKIRLLKH